LQSLATTPVSRRVDVRRPVVKIIAESLSQHDEKHVVPTPLSGIRVGRRKFDPHSTVNSTSYYALCTALISKAQISNCKCIT
jgi:hypothetical protein